MPLIASNAARRDWHRFDEVRRDKMWRTQLHREGEAETQLLPTQCPNFRLQLHSDSRLDESDGSQPRFDLHAHARREYEQTRVACETSRDPPERTQFEVLPKSKSAFRVGKPFTQCYLRDRSNRNNTMLHETAHALALLRPSSMPCLRSASPCSARKACIVATDTPPRRIAPASPVLSPTEQICRRPAGMLVEQGSRAAGIKGPVCISPPALHKHPLFPLPSAGQLRTNAAITTAGVVLDSVETKRWHECAASSSAPPANAQPKCLSVTCNPVARIAPGLTPLAWEAATAPGSALNGKCASVEMRNTRALNDTRTFVLG